MDFLANNQMILEPSAVTVGMFDGLHLGHKALIGQLKENANGLKTLIFTFCVQDESQSIYTNDEKRLLLEKTGVDYAYLQAFKPDFLNTDREEFVLQLKNKYNMVSLTAGEDFRFGKGAMGDAEYLLKNADRFGLDVHIVPPVLWKGEKVSSTKIRALISAGDVKLAGRLLGEYYFATGTVEPEKKTGTRIGFQTVIISTSKLTPQNGTYATFAEVGGKRHKSVTNVGVSPTVSDAGKVNIETNIFDFNYKIYNTEVTIYFVEMIREENKFASIEALKRQIVWDKQKAIGILNNKNVYKPD